MDFVALAPRTSFGSQEDGSGSTLERRPDGPPFARSRAGRGGGGIA